MRLWDNKYIKALAISLFSGLLVFAGMQYSGLFARLTPEVSSEQQTQTAQQQQGAQQGQKQGAQQQGQQAGGLAGARQRAAGGQYTRKELSQEAVEALEKEQEAPGEEEGGDLYTQSEAHLQLDEVKEKMKEFLFFPRGEKTPNEMVAPYLNIIAAALKREVQFKKTHYVFYHASNSEWRVPQDLYKLLYAYYNPLKPIKDFIFMRFVDLPTISAKDYLLEHFGEFGGINDNEIAEKIRLISTNLALFGNVGFTGECSWNYFVQNKSHSSPTGAKAYENILKAFDLQYDLDSLQAETDELEKMLIDASEEQGYYQIFVPKEKADQVAWLSWVLGFPAHPKSVDLVLNTIKGKPLIGKYTGPAVMKLIGRLKREGEDSSLYNELIEAVENGDFGVSAFLTIYRNTPWKLRNPNETQARLLVTNDVLLNPESGVKFFLYVTTPRDIEEKYLKMIADLAKKIIDNNSKLQQNKE